MGNGRPDEMRIYCICGQKMKVSGAMFGLPGKCVACRQRIRIPTLGEIDPGTTEVYLKDHPEFLRKPSGKRKGLLPKAPVADESEGVELGDSAELVSAAILDILEPLRVLCSLSYKLQRQVDAMRAGNGNILSGEEPATLTAYLERVRDARSELDDQLRQRLMEIAIELSSTGEKIVQAGLSLRIGETSLDAFRETVDRLRHRRDHLDRLQQNIRGWLTVTDPHVAGGYANVSLDAVPESGFQAVLPSENEHYRSLFDEHIEALRDALTRRERAELRLSETNRLRADGSMSELVLADCRAHAQAEKARAESEVTFRRKRLEQLSADYAGDIQTIQAARDRLTRQLKDRMLDASLHDSLERDLVRAQNDCANVHGVIAHALIASTPQDVPAPHGSLIKRMARPVASPNLGGDMDCWLAWGSAVALGLSVFLPVVDDLSPIRAYQELSFQGEVIHWVMTLPVLLGVLVTLAGILPWRIARGISLMGLWLIATVAAAWFVHEAQYSIEPIAERFRQGIPWIYRPGMLLVTAADLGVLIAAGVALAPFKRVRALIPLACGVCCALLLAIFTDWAGTGRPYPELSATWTEHTTSTGSVYETVVTVRNQGRRLLVIGPGTGLNATTYVLERAKDDQTWQDVAFLKPNDTRQVASGEAAAFHHTLKPGDYRVRLHARSNDGDVATTTFSLPVSPSAPANVPVESPPPPEAATTAPVQNNPPEPASSTSPATPNAETAEVELRGMVNAEAKGARFSIVIFPPDGTISHLDRGVGDPIYGNWIVSEFNPTRQTVTLVNGEHLLILNRGKKVALP